MGEALNAEGVKMGNRNDVIQTLMTMGTMYDKAMNEAAADMYVRDLSAFEPDDILAALKKCRMEISRFPTVAEIISRAQMQDGRPGIEEAWSMCPKSEEDAAYLNDEIMAGWGVARGLVEMGDEFNAGRAFKEIYSKTVQKNREAGIKPKWFLSGATGRDRAMKNQAAIIAATEKNYISIQEAKRIIPEIEFKPQRDQKTISNASGMTSNKDVTKMIVENKLLFPKD